MINLTNPTAIKKNLSRRNLSTKSIIEELNGLETLGLEDLLQSVKTLEEGMDNLLSIEDQIARIDEAIEQMEKELEGYLSEG